MHLGLDRAPRAADDSDFNTYSFLNLHYEQHTSNFTQIKKSKVDITGTCWRLPIARRDKDGRLYPDVFFTKLSLRKRIRVTNNISWLNE
jgi:hypothetical protein